MKTLAMLAIFLALPLAGCRSVTSTLPSASLASGFSSQADQTMDQVLVGARTFYSTVQCETQGLNWSQTTSQCIADTAIKTPMVLSATEKTSFNTFGQALNAAESIYQAFHAGTATQAQAQASVDSVNAQQVALQVSITGGN